MFLAGVRGALEKMLLRRPRARRHRTGAAPGREALLQELDGMPDCQALEMLRYHAGWNFALNRQVGDALFHPTTRVHFRQRLLDHEKEHVGYKVQGAGTVRRAEWAPGEPTQNFPTSLVPHAAHESDEAGSQQMEAEPAAMGLEKPPVQSVDGAYVSAEKRARFQAEGRVLMGWRRSRRATTADALPPQTLTRGWKSAGRCVRPAKQTPNAAGWQKRPAAKSVTVLNLETAVEPRRHEDTKRSAKSW